MTPESRGYYIKDLGIGFGVFKKMDDPKPKTAGTVILKDNMLINVGEVYVVVNIIPDDYTDENSLSQIKLKIFGGANNGEIYEYNQDEMQNERKILIGRTPECDIKISDKLLSKV